MLLIDRAHEKKPFSRTDTSTNTRNVSRERITEIRIHHFSTKIICVINISFYKVLNDDKTQHIYILCAREIILTNVKCYCE